MLILVLRFRSMMIFGQGVNRSHPSLLSVVAALERGNDERGFFTAVSSFLGHLAGNVSASFARGFAQGINSLTPGGSSPTRDPAAYYEARLSKQAANFAATTDLALTLGGRLKFEEMISGRLADAFGTLYLGYACLWYHRQHRNVEGIDALLIAAMETLLQQNQTALAGVASNFPLPVVGPIMRLVQAPSWLDRQHYTGERGMTATHTHSLSCRSERRTASRSGPPHHDPLGHPHPPL
jgi:acyl-CoA dehydrogenase